VTARRIAAYIPHINHAFRINPVESTAETPIPIDAHGNLETTLGADPVIVRLVR
jgi:hypothetical protein